MTVETDVWTYAMTVLVRLQSWAFKTSSDLSFYLLKELITDSPPYTDIASEAAVIKKISLGILPTWPNSPTANMPAHVADALREMCGRCWILQPPLRPSMTVINDDLSRVEYDRR